MLQVRSQLFKEAHHMLRLAAELRPQLRLLRSNSSRTGIEMALTRHIATQRYQHCGAEGVLIRTQQSRDQNVTRSRQTAIRAQTDTATHPVIHQDLLRLRQPKLPRVARVLDTGERRGTRATAAAGNHDDVRRPL